MNSFFEVAGPFRIFRHVGVSASNSYVGASRMFATVMEAINAQPGDEIHTLAGGTFLIRDGGIGPISLRAPKPPFEKNYGGDESDATIMKNYVKEGLAVEIPRPAGKIDYAVARQRVHDNLLPAFHREIVHVEDSPRFAEMRAIVDAFVQELALAGIAPTVKAQDITAYGGPQFDVVVDGQRIRFGSGVSGVFFVEVPEAVRVEGDKDAIEVNGRKKHFFRDIDGIADPIGAARDFLFACGRALAVEEPQMGM